MRTRLVVLSLLLSASSARADESSLRGRWGFGLAGGLDVGQQTDSRASTPIGLGGGMYTRAGVQWNEAFDLELEGSVGTIVLSNYVHGGLLFGVTFDWLTVSAGPGLGFNASWGTGKETYAAVAARVDFHFWRHLTDTGVRWALTGSLSGEFGYALEQFSASNRRVPNGYAWGAYATFGPTWY